MLEKTKHVVPLWTFIILVYQSQVRAQQYDSLIKTSTTFLGTGYNIVKGNPEGASIQDGGLDPGLRSSLQILKSTVLDHTQSACPIEANCVRLESSSVFKQCDFVDDLIKYRSEYQKSWRLESKLGFSKKFDFYGAVIASTTQREISDIVEAKQDVIVTEQTWSIHADVYYKYGTHKTLTQEFQSHLCRLPQVFNKKHQSIFFQFFETWGTHVIVQARLGSRRLKRQVFSKHEYLLQVQKHYSKLAQIEFITGVTFMSVSSEATTGYSNDIAKTLMATNNHYAQYDIITGSSSSPVPVSLVLIDVTSFLTPEYVDLSNSSSCYYHSEDSLANLQLALQDALIKFVTMDREEPQFTKRVTELSWPNSTYSLPMPLFGCPKNWEIGYRFHDLEDSSNTNSWSSEINSHLRIDLGKDLGIYFCTKTKRMAFPDYFGWTQGSYCFFKKGDCPVDFDIASWYVDDEDSKNKNNHFGYLPDGDYGRNTLYQMCCRNDGDPDSPILLPTSSPFFLFPVLDRCQAVREMTSQLHFIKFDTEDSEGHTNIEGISTPKHEIDKNKNVMVQLCYYSRINTT